MRGYKPRGVTAERRELVDQRVLDALIDWREEHDESPSITVLAKHLGMSFTTCKETLARMRAAGSIDYGRTLELTPLRLDAHP